MFKTAESSGPWPETLGGKGMAQRLLNSISLAAAVISAAAIVLLLFDLDNPSFPFAHVKHLSSARITAAFLTLAVFWLSLRQLQSASRRKVVRLMEDGRELRRLSSAMLRLTTSKTIFSGDTSLAIRELSEIGADTLKVERIGVWLFSEAQDRFRAFNLYQRSTHKHEGALEILLSQAPLCLNALQNNRIIAVDDVQADPLMLEHRPFLAQRGITSCMAASIHMAGKLLGFITIAHVGQPRQWSTEEQNFAASLADTAAMIFEVAKRKEAEQKLLESRQFLRQVIDTDPNFIFVKDPAGRFVLVNQAVADAYGTTVENLCGKTDADFNPEISEVCHFRADDNYVIETGRELLIPEEKITDANGKVRWLQTMKRPLEHPDTHERHVLGVSTDITERRRLHEQLAQTQKMDALGQLAGGVAHDFNNIMTGILGYTTLLKMAHHDNQEIWHCAEMIEQSATRAADLTQKLLGFARKGKHQNTRIDMHAIVRDTVAILARTIEANIKISLNLAADCPYVMGDPSQIQQIILNLAINARHAMCREYGGSNGGELTISTKVLNPPSIAATNDDLYTVKQLEVAVSDTGCGIEESQFEKIFEPFYTTKGEGRGTGMGLAMVYGIVKNHGGTIHVESRLNKGSTFRVRLPLAAPPPVHQIEKIYEAPRPGRGFILIVDDHQVVREVTSEMLSLLGYKAVTAKDGMEAVEYYRQNKDQVDLVIIDLIMPRMGARECVQAIKEINPTARVILSTGYGPTNSVREVLDQGVAGFVQKPYKLEVLSKVVAEALQLNNEAPRAN